MILGTISAPYDWEVLTRINKEGQRTLVSVATPGWQMIICLICR